MSSDARAAAGGGQHLDYYEIDELLTDEERLIRDSVREFVNDRVLPGPPSYEQLVQLIESANQ